MLLINQNLETGAPVPVTASPKVQMRQYDGSPIIQSILDSWGINFSTNIFDEIYNQCWDIDNASGLWLDIWGRKVCVDRNMRIPATENWFGFNETGNDWFPFNDGIFYSVAETQAYSLSDPAYRLLVLSKAAANITSCTASDINKWLDISFPNRGNCYVSDTGAMTLSYIFNFNLEVWEIAVLTQGKVLPRPAGVQATLVVNGVTYNVN